MSSSSSSSSPGMMGKIEGFLLCTGHSSPSSLPVRVWSRYSSISHAIQFYCESKGYSVVRELVGHGIGRKMHEEPEVPNSGRPGCGPLLRSGMCICIEPMINMGSKNVVFEKDGWTVRTKDRKCSAHFEHCIAIRPEGPQILSSFEFLEEVLGNNAI